LTKLKGRGLRGHSHCFCLWATQPWESVE